MKWSAAIARSISLTLNKLEREVTGRPARIQQVILRVSLVSRSR